MSKARAFKTFIIFMVFILIIVEIFRKKYAIHDFSVLQRTDSKPANIYRFRSHTGKDIHSPPITYF